MAAARGQRTALETQIVPVRGGMFQVEVQKGGRGEPLVYLHGGGLPEVWAPFLQMLAQGYTVYQPRHPGWGESTGLEHLDDVIDMALFYLDFFDALGLPSVNLLGSSLGGMFAAEIAALGTSYVKKLVLANPVGLWRDDVLPLDFFTAGADELQKATFYDPEAATVRRPAVSPDDKEAVAAAMLDRQKSLSATGKFIWPIWDKGLKKRIHRIKAPTLIVWGEKDGVIPPVYGEEFQTRIAGAKLVVMPKAGHVPMEEQPEEFVRIVREFLASQS